MTTDQPSIEALLEAALNLSRHHRDHEKYYAAEPHVDQHSPRPCRRDRPRHAG